MDSSALKDISLLKSVRGTFADQKSTLLRELFWSGLCGVAFPLLFGFVLLHDGLPKWPFTADDWAVLLLIPASLFLGWFFWFYAGGEYEFTGLGVALRRRGKRRNSVPWENVHNLELQEDRFGHVTVILKGHGVRFPILMYPSLKDEIARKGAEPGASPNGSSTTSPGNSGAARGATIGELNR